MSDSQISSNLISAYQEAYKDLENLGNNSLQTEKFKQFYQQTENMPRSAFKPSLLTKSLKGSNTKTKTGTHTLDTMGETQSLQSKLLEKQQSERSAQNPLTQRAKKTLSGLGSNTSRSSAKPLVVQDKFSFEDPTEPLNSAGKPTLNKTAFSMIKPSDSLPSSTRSSCSYLRKVNMVYLNPINPDEGSSVNLPSKLNLTIEVPKFGSCTQSLKSTSLRDLKNPQVLRQQKKAQKGMPSSDRKEESQTQSGNKTWQRVKADSQGQGQPSLPQSRKSILKVCSTRGIHRPGVPKPEEDSPSGDSPLNNLNFSVKKLTKGESSYSINDPSRVGTRHQSRLHSNVKDSQRVSIFSNGVGKKVRFAAFGVAAIPIPEAENEKPYDSKVGEKSDSILSCSDSGDEFNTNGKYRAPPAQGQPLSMRTPRGRKLTSGRPLRFREAKIISVRKIGSSESEN